MGKHVLEEASKCLQCKKPLCKEGCPVKTPRNDVINMLLNGKIMESGEVLFNNNPLSVVCSLVCPHEKQCEGHCILNKKNNPVHFSQIEHYISQYYLNFIKTEKINKLNKNIAIIGSGPAGITIAFILAMRGYNITIFEAHDKIGGVLRYGIPEFRLPKDILELLKEKLLSLGVKIRPNTLIGPVITIDDIFRDGYEAIFIGTGVWKPRTLGIKGETLGHVHFAIDYLKNPDVYNLGDKVCIIGAGNVAMDVARTALRKGAKEVYVLSRGGEDYVTADKHEVDYAKLDGVTFEFFKAPVEIVNSGLKYIETHNIIDENGTEHLKEIPGSETIFEADSVIVAISQGPRANIVSNTNGIKIDNRGLVTVDECGRTSREGVFASGDVVTGAKTVVEAVRFSKMAADAIDEYVLSKTNS
jgi:glutamate synthase (NADPH/NADH) small chain